MTPHDAAPIDAAVQRVLAQAERLPSGDCKRHVQASARDLASACWRRQGVPAAVDRFAASVRQLQAGLAEGTRRRERDNAPAVERLLEALQEELLPELRRSGLLERGEHS